MADGSIGERVIGWYGNVAADGIEKRPDFVRRWLMTGGVAQNEGVVAAAANALGAEVRTHPDSQLCGALGAALLGLESLR